MIGKKVKNQWYKSAASVITSRA